MLSSSIGPAAPPEVEAAEIALQAHLAGVGPLWGEDEEAEATRLRVILDALYDLHNVADFDRIA